MRFMLIKLTDGVNIGENLEINSKMYEVIEIDAANQLMVVERLD